MAGDPGRTRARSSGARERDPWLFALLALVAAIGFLSMPAVRYDGDVNAWEMEAESLVYQGRLVVRASVAESVEASAPYFVFNADTGNWHSKYGIGNTFIYALPLAFERFVLGQSELSAPSNIFGETSGPYHITRRLLLLNGFNLLLSGLLALVTVLEHATHGDGFFLLGRNRSRLRASRGQQVADGLDLVGFLGLHGIEPKVGALLQVLVTDPG